MTAPALFPHDAEAMNALYQLSLKANPHGFIQDLSYHGPLADKAQAWVQAGGTFLVLKEQAQLVGMGGLRPISAARAELCKLHVHPQAQGKGYGRRLAEGLLREAATRGFGTVELHVTVTQTAAVALYHKLGFAPTQRAVFETTVGGVPVSYDTLYMEKAL
jgi:ribosomal protein S18 acetylase RimI-like enzyme